MEVTIMKSYGIALLLSLTSVLSVCSSGMAAQEKTPKMAESVKVTILSTMLAVIQKN
jgi:hypothetical protein